jgi:O-acetyl-ADP-ribose deacetylase (regulator of RNase III)
MPKMFYFATRPETVVSLLTQGVFPQNIKKWSYINQKKIQLFETATHADENSNALKKNTYILCLNCPDDFIGVGLEQAEDGTVSVLCDVLPVDKLCHIVVSQKSSEKTLLKLFNDRCPFTIIVDPSYFSDKKINRDNQAPEVDVVKPQSLVRSIKVGDLLGSSMEVLINTVNCVGVMGKGIAYSFKERYPKMYEDYRKRCLSGMVKVGEPYLYRLNDKQSIINFPTKQHWKNPSKIEYLEDGLKYLALHAQEWKIQSMAVPPLGCGNGGLSWDVVKPLILHHLVPLNIPIEIYEPFESRFPIVKNQKKAHIEKPAQILKRFFSSEEKKDEENGPLLSLKKSKN